MRLQASPKLLWPVLALAIGVPALAETVTTKDTPTQYWTQPTSPPPQEEKKDDKAQKILQMLQQMGRGQGGASPRDRANQGWKKEREAIQQDVEQSEKSGGGKSGAGDDRTPPDISSMPVGSHERTAYECGVKAQKECHPSNRGGDSRCGEAVKIAVSCMSPALTGSKCDSQCGPGKNWVNCGKLTACGYTKATNPNDPKCHLPGAIRAYSKTHTPMGAKFGHVEFVCGRGKYCSIYDAPLPRPWPRSNADACYIPTGGSGASS